MEHWGIVGGGMLGMTLAHRLRQQGRRVTLLEAAPNLGGLASAWSLGDVVWDRHYHVILLSDAYLRGVLAEIGLDGEVRWSETKTGFYVDGSLHSMSNALEFLRFPPLGLVEKLRLAATILWASRIRDWKPLERVPVAEWLERWSGRGTCEKIWLPLLRAKLGDCYTRTSAAFIWATIDRMYAARRTGLKKEMFGYVAGGYARILERFGEALAEAGVAIELESPARGIEPLAGGGLEVRFGKDRRERFDGVVVTLPAPLVPALCPALSDSEAAALRGLEYVGVVCASVLLDAPLTPYYVTNVTDAWVPFTAVIETSALVDPDQLGGRGLVYLPRYASPGDPVFDEPDAALRERFLGALARMHPGFTESRVRAFQVSRARHVFALSTLGYSDTLPPSETSVPGLHVVNSSQIVNGTLNVNETVQLAERAWPRLLGSAGA